MGRTITGANKFIGLKKSKKTVSKKKNKNISKWGKPHTQEDIQVDTFELQSPRGPKHTIDMQWE